MSKSYDTDDTTRDAQWSPPDGYGWGEGTEQAREVREDTDEEPAPEWWTDTYEMRMRFGVPEFDRDAHDRELYVDTLVHEKPAKTTSSAGGTNFLRVGEKGCGKSTDNLNWALRLMEVNQEKVAWRGSPGRSEWLPFRDYATLWLPANAEISGQWVYDAEGREPEGVEAIEDLVREVRYYDDVLDVVEELSRHPKGTFNVVYPDPSFAGCEELTQRSHRTGETLPFTPAWEAVGDESGTPLAQWWVAFWLARTDFATNRSWLSLMFDEFHQLFPSDTEQDTHRSYAKMSLFCECVDDSRRARTSLFATIHRESKAHWKPREEFDVRVDMPDETPNPRKNKVRSIPQGFGEVPMYADIMSNRPVGSALMYNQREFVLYQWTDLKAGSESEDRKLVLSLEKGATDEEDTGPSLEYDSAIFQRWKRGDHDRLYVQDPGDGYVDLQTAQVVEDLESPTGGLEFDGLRTGDDEVLVTMVDRSSGESVVAARIPQRRIGLADSGELDESDLEHDDVEESSEVIRSD